MLTHLVAVGDIHGQHAMLLDLVKAVHDYMETEKLAYGEHWNFVFLGDYIDRGPESDAVVDTLRGLHAQGAICLRGNHEQMAIDDLAAALEDQTLDSWLARSQSELDAEDRVTWFENLPLFHETEKHFFVHGGAHPDLPLWLQAIREDKRTFLWIRDRFLDHQEKFAKYIVHGHTPTHQSDADVRHNRCNLDTGAGYGHKLSAAIFDLDKTYPIHKISVDGLMQGDAD